MFSFLFSLIGLIAVGVVLLPCGLSFNPISLRHIKILRVHEQSTVSAAAHSKQFVRHFKFRVFALNPGIMERIAEIRLNRDALNAKVKTEREEGIVHDDTVLSSLRIMNTIVESEQALQELDKNLALVKENLAKPELKEKARLKQHFASLTEVKTELEENLNEAVLSIKDDEMLI